MRRWARWKTHCGPNLTKTNTTNAVQADGQNDNATEPNDNATEPNDNAAEPNDNAAEPNDNADSQNVNADFVDTRSSNVLC